MEEYTYNLRHHLTHEEKEINYKDLPEEFREWLKARSKRKKASKRFLEQVSQFAGDGWYYMVRLKGEFSNGKSQRY